MSDSDSHLTLWLSLSTVGAMVIVFVVVVLAVWWRRRGSKEG